MKKVVNGEIRKLKSRIDKAEESLKGLTKELEELEFFRDRLLKALSSKEKEVLGILRELRAKEREFETIKGKIRKHDKILKGRVDRRKLTSLIKTRERLSAKAYEVSDQIARLRHRYDLLKAEEMEIYQKLTTAEREIEKLKREISHFLTELKGLNDLLERKIREVSERFGL